MSVSFTHEEIEENRQEALLKVDHDRLENYEPGSYDEYAAMHTAYVLMETVETQLMEHGAIILDAVAYRHAHEAHTSLFNLYQRVGTLEFEQTRSQRLLRALKRCWRELQSAVKHRPMARED